MTKIVINNVVREMTAEEQAEHDARQQAYIDDSANRKLAQIKEIRSGKLIETDWMANSDVTMSDAWKTKRQAWRDIPQDFSTEEQYDLLLNRNDLGELTHSVWKKP